MLKTEVLKALESKKGSPVSGEALANALGVSRTAIWKAINALKKDGHKIETLNGKGYILSQADNKLSKEGILTHLKNTSGHIYVFNEVDSTNTTAIGLANSNASHGTIVVAETQNKGKGRRGRSFYSPEGTGIYMSVILKPEMDINHSILITTAASVAVMRAIKDICNLDVKIKWVNDIYLDEKKLCGILTEAVTDFESGQISHVVVGMGINCFNDHVPSDLKDIIGALNIENLDRNKLIASVTDNLLALIAQLQKGDRSFLEEYKKASLLLGKEINIFESTILTEDNAIPAKALNIDQKGGLVVKLADGTEKTLSTGEVSIRLK